MSKRDEALRYHSSGRKGKIQVTPTKPHSTQRDLALAYSPGVAEPCLEIDKNVENVYKYTAKGNLVAVISNGTAVLGLGNIGPEASKPVMEGKGLLFKIFSDIDVFDIEVDATDVDKFVETVKAIAPTFGGINLEDIKAPEAFEIERRLIDELDIPVMHDDQHGTAIISAAALINALEIAGKDITKVKIVVNGAGAAAISCSRLYIAVGANPKNIVMCDSRGVIRSDRTDLTEQKREFATDADLDTLEDAMKGADVFIGLSKGDVVSPEMLLTMAEDPIVFAMANPDPEIPYALAVDTRDDVIMATGRSDTPNQVNNVLGFPFIFRGALDVRATKINEEMKVAATRAIASLTKKPVPEQVLMAYNMKSLSFGKEYIIPKPFDHRLITHVAPAVAKAAMDSGVATSKISDWDAYEESLMDRMEFDSKLLRLLQNRATTDPQRVVFAEADHFNVLRAAHICYEEGACIPILLGEHKTILNLMEEHDMLMDVEIINPKSNRYEEKRNQFAQMYWEKRNRHGVNKYDALRLMRDRDYFGSMMVEMGEADAIISGYSKNFKNALVPMMQIIGKQEGIDMVATANIVFTQKGPLFLSDTAININPNAQELVNISRMTRSLAKYFAIEPRLALVSHSNFGSSKTTSTEKIKESVAYMHKHYPKMIVDGELQADFALNEALLNERYPFSKLAGNEEANVLIFPDLDSANISYKLLKAVNENESVGPITMGMNKPAHVVYMGASVEEIVNMVYISVADAQQYKARVKKN